MMKTQLIITFLLVSFTYVRSQDFEVPSYTLKKAADFAQYEKDIIAAVNWLAATPVQDQVSKRGDATRFLIEWLTGSPNVSVEINGEIVNFTKPNTELLIMFMGGWTKYVLETNDKSKLKGNLSGIEMVIAFYQKSRKDLKRDKNVEKYVEMKEKGTLEEFLKKNL
jgi:hypothetical protein